MKTISEDQMTDRVARKIRCRRTDLLPPFVLIVGAGLSSPVVPTARRMLVDIPWWLYCRQCGGNYEREHEREGDTERQAFERSFWENIRKTADIEVGLNDDGLPEHGSQDNAARAYMAVMSGRSGAGLFDRELRRMYLRDVVARVGKRTTPAYLYLGAILAAQDTWELGSPFCRTIVTTNFDPLLQRALQLAGKLYCLDDRPQHMEIPIDEFEEVHLLHTHGTIHRYDLRNTWDEINDARRQNAFRMSRYLSRHGVIVVGYGGWPDTTMDALREADGFEGNLYWCDIHPEEIADQRLSESAKGLIERQRASAYYVPIESAGSFFRKLHAAFDLGQRPSFLADPLHEIIAQLESIRETSVVRGEKSGAAPEPFREMIDSNLYRLDLAREVYDSPEIIDGASQELKDRAKRAEIERQLSQGEQAWWAGQYRQAKGLYAQVLCQDQATARQRARALLYRGFCFSKLDESDKESQDHTRLIEMQDAPDRYRAMALGNRILYDDRQSDDEKLRDIAILLGLAGAPSFTRGAALKKRADIYAHEGDREAALRDCNAVLNLRDVVPSHRARAFELRGYIRFKMQSDIDGLVADSRAALEEGGDLPCARVNLALGLLLQGEGQEALRQYRQVAKENANAKFFQEAIVDIEEAFAERELSDSVKGVRRLLESRIDEIADEERDGEPDNL